MAFRMVEIEQQYVFQECKKNNRKDSFEQYPLDKLAALLHDCCRNVAGVQNCGNGFLVGLNPALCESFLGIQANCASERSICLYASYKAAHAAFEDFSFHFFKIEFNTATKCVQKFVEQDWILYSFCPIVRRCTSDETIYKFYIRITSTSSSKRYLINLAYLGVNLKKILAIIREAPSEIYAPKSFKPRIKKSLIALRSTFCIFSYIDVLLTISSVSQHGNKYIS